MTDLIFKYPGGLRIREDVLFKFDAKEVAITFREKILKIGIPFQASIEALKKTLVGLKPDELGEVMILPGLKQILSELDRRGCLSHLYPEYDASNRHANQLQWLSNFTHDPVKTQNRIQNTLFVVLGCGGTGTVITENLVGIGGRNFLLIDSDQVSSTNFNRQFAFKGSDLGRAKVDALRDYICERVPQSSVSTAQIRVSQPSELVSVIPSGNKELFLVCAADQPIGQIEQLVTEAARTLAAPCIFGNVGLMDGRIGPLLTDTPAKTRFIEKMAAITQDAQLYHQRSIMSASCGPVNSVIGSLIALEILGYFSNLRESNTQDRVLDLNLKTFEARIAYV